MEYDYDADVKKTAWLIGQIEALRKRVEELESRVVAADLPDPR